MLLSWREPCAGVAAARRRREKSGADPIDESPFSFMVE
jgi:hypothetical protein